MPCKIRWEVPSVCPTQTRINPTPATGNGISRELPGCCIATQNMRSESSALASILRYRGSKMYNGSNACGNRVALGNVMTGKCCGNFTGSM